MSLVNEMLRDLEQRRSDTPTAEISWMSNDNGSTLRQRGSLIIMLVILAVMVSVLWLLSDNFFSAPDASKPVVIPSEPSLPIASQAAMPEPKITTEKLSAGMPPKQLVALGSQNTDNGLSISMEFTAPVAYTTETRSNLLRLRFADVQQSGEIVLPDIPAELAILQLIDEGDVLVLTLQTRNAVSYQLRRVDDKNLLIVITGLPLETHMEIAGSQVEVTEVQSNNNDESTDEMATALPLAEVTDPKRVRQLTPQQQDQQLARQARQQLRNGERNKAQQALANYVSQYPQFARETGHLLASLLIENRDTEAALRLLKNLRQLMAEDIPLRQLQAQLLLAKNNPVEALQLLREAAPALRDYPAYYEIQAAAAQKTGDSQFAAQTYQRLLAMDQQRGDWWVGFAIALDSSGQAPRAREAFRNALNDRDLSPALREYSRQRLDQLSLNNPIPNP